MYKNLAFGLLVISLLLSVSCRMRDIRTVIIDVPQLRGEECAQRLHALLASVDGVDGGKLVFEPGRITVTYDSMKLALKNLEYLIAGVGFQANATPANPEARQRLPERCR